MTNKTEILRNELSRLATLQQSDAANPENSVWVEASAGTGKTKVLSDRVLRLLLAKVNPSKILCLTYTKAAAVEMNERIAKRLSSWAVEDDDSLKKELCLLLGKKIADGDADKMLSFARTLFANLLDTPGGMKIQTIHSFCQDILKRFPLEAGVSPYFDVMDDRSSKEILQDIKVDLLKSADADSNLPLAQAISYLTRTVSEYKFPEILNMITENRNRIDLLLKKHDNNITDIIHILYGKLELNLEDTEESIKADFFEHIDRTIFKQATEAFSHGGKEDIDRAETFAYISSHCFGIEGYPLYKNVFLTGSGTIRKRLAGKNVIQAMPEILVFLNDEANRVLKTERLLASLRILQTTKAILYIAQNIITKYREYKETYATLDYEDLIIITRQLLENSSVADWVLFKLDGGIDHILIDEAQDTSPNQWAIVKAITQEFFSGNGRQESNALSRTVFVVGDRKQSIYSFQGADPNEFDRMYRYFAQKSRDFCKVHLDVSFRSTQAIMDCVNTLFNIDTAKKGVVPDGEYMNHQPFRVGDGGKVEIWPLLVPEDAPQDDSYNWRIPIKREQRISVSNTLARQIAMNIKKMVENKDILVSKNRPVQYGDFMFLVQQRKTFVEEFVRACKDIGVKVAGVDKLKLLEQIAVQDLISLGKFLLLPTDDLSLAEVLKSPIFGLDDDDLFILCHQRSSSLFNSILMHEDYAETAEKLKNLLNLSGFSRPFELFNTIFVKLDGRKKFITRMGNEVEDVLDEFLNLTLIFEQDHTPTLEAFINWILQDEVIVQKEMEQGSSDTVKIMTVHGSKGLQAPIVILADTVKVKNKAKTSEFLWDDDDLFYFPPNASSYDDVCARLKEKRLDADFDEYRRLLYVALTRAEDRLYIAGFSKTKEADEQSWYKLLSDNISSNVILPDGDKHIVYDIPQTAEVKVRDDESGMPAGKTEDYSFLMTPAPVETPLAKPYAPSKNEADEIDITASPLTEHGQFYRRGTVIHRLLQYVGTIEAALRESAAYIFLKKYLPDFSAHDISDIVAEVMELCKNYPDIFSPESQAEVPIIGEIDGKIMSAKIDRLIVLENKVLIVDYKTNRPAARTTADVPPAYLKQMSDYKRLMQHIYPEKEIETYLLWTNTCNMMKV